MSVEENATQAVAEERDARAEATRIMEEEKKRNKSAFIFTQEAFNFVVRNMPIGQQSYARDADAVLKHLLDALGLSEEDFQEE